MGALPWIIRDPAKFYADHHARYHKDAIVSWNYAMGGLMYFVSDVDLARRVFSEADVFQFLMTPWKPILGEENIAFLQGDAHHRLRRRIMPLLQRTALEHYHPRIDRCLADHMAELRALQLQAGSVPVDLMPPTRRVATQSAVTVVCGAALPQGDLPGLIDDFEMMNRAFLALPLSKIPGTVHHKAVRARGRIHDRLVRYVASGRARLAAGGAPDCVLESWLVRIASEAGDDPDRSSDEDIARTAIDLIFASQDGLFSTFLWVWVRLHDHPEVLDRLRAELHEHGVSSGPISFETLNELVYLRWFVKEIFRFQPPAPVIPHRVACDVELVPGVRLREGDIVFPLIQGMQTDAYEDGDVFDPDRFSPERQNAVSNKAYFAFGLGPHRCPGMEYTYVIMAMYAAQLAQSFDWSRTRTKASDRLYSSPSLCPWDVLLTLKDRAALAEGAA